VRRRPAWETMSAGLLAWTAYRLLRPLLTLLADPGTDPDAGKWTSAADQLGLPVRSEHTRSCVIVLALALILLILLFFLFLPRLPGLPHPPRRPLLPHSRPRSYSLSRSLASAMHILYHSILLPTSALSSTPTPSSLSRLPHYNLYSPLFLAILVPINFHPPSHPAVGPPLPLTTTGNHLPARPVPHPRPAPGEGERPQDPPAHGARAGDCAEGRGGDV
jgi:hypothetical protein